MSTCAYEIKVRQCQNGELSEAEEQELPAHVQGCPTCMALLRTATAFLDTTPKVQGKTPKESESPYVVPSGLVEQVKEAGSSDGDPSAKQDVEPVSEITFPGPRTDQAPLGELEDFFVLRLVEKGGYGAVYEALDKSTGNKVAIKVLRPGPANDPRHRERFCRDAEAAASIDSPHVVKVRHVRAKGSHDFSLPYFVKEYIEGESLARRIEREKALKPVEAARIVLGVAHGLAAIHERGIVHRDIKPGNILLPHAAASEQDGETTASPLKITDFGLASRLETLDSAAASSKSAPTSRPFRGAALTATGEILGTPDYMSPEQCDGTDDVDCRSDIFSLGVVIYELLTGERPFRGTILKILEQIRRTDPRPPRQLNESVPADLETITLKCLTKELDRRYQSSTDLADDLHRCLAGEPINAQPVSRAERFSRWCRRNPALASLSAALVLVVFAGLAGVTWQWQRAEAEAEESSHRLVRMNVANSARLIEEGDFTGALLWQAEALRLDQGNPMLEKMHRLRFAATLRRCPRLVQVWLNDGPMKHAVFSHDARYVTAVSNDNLTRTWDESTGELVNSPLMSGADANHVSSLSSDGRLLVGVDDDGIARIRVATSGEAVGSPLKHSGKVQQASFSPDSQRVVTVSDDDTVRAWDVSTSNPITPPLRHSNLVRHASFSPDGRRLVTASHDKTVRVWDLPTEGPAAPPLQHNGIVTCASFSPEGRRVATASVDQTVRVWDAATGDPVTPPLRHNGTVNHVSFSADGHRLITASNDQTARVWNGATGEPITPPLRHSNYVVHATFSPDGSRVVTSSWDQTARVWDATTGEPVTPFLKHDTAVHLASFSPDGRRVVTASGPPTAPALVPIPMDRLLVGATHGDLTLMPTPERQESEARVWDAASGAQLILRPMKHGSSVYHASFSQDGRRVLTASNDFTARIWEADSGNPLTPYLKHSGMMVSFSPDGDRFVTASIECCIAPPERHEREARVWAVATGKPVTPPFKHDSTVTRALFSPDGSLVATVNDAAGQVGCNEACVWDASAGEAVSLPLKHRGDISQVSFSSNGRRLLTVSGNQAFVWEIPTTIDPVQDLVHLAQVYAGRRVDVTGGLEPLESADLHRAFGMLRKKYPDEFVLSAEEVLAWHWQEAERSEAANRWPMVLFHLDRLVTARAASCSLRIRRGNANAAMCQWSEALADYSKAIELEADNHLIWSLRGDVYAQLNSWDRAIADFSHAVKLDPNNAWYWYKRSLLQLASGDSSGYRDACETMLDRFGETEVPETARRVAWVCLLSQDAVVDHLRPLQLAEIAVASNQTQSTDTYLRTHSLALYRAGQYEAAAQSLGELINADVRPDAVQPPLKVVGGLARANSAIDWLLLAFAHCRLGHIAEARQWLDKAVHWIDLAIYEDPNDSASSGPSNPQSTSILLSWTERLELQLLRREAESLVSGVSNDL